MTTKARAGIPLPRNKRAESVRLLRVWLERYKIDRETLESSTRDFEEAWAGRARHPILDLIDDRELKLASFISASWLRGELAELGCPEERANRICFATGQIQAATATTPEEIWTLCAGALATYREGGAFPEPGAGLAIDLILKFGFPQRLLRAIRNLGKDKALQMLRDNPLPPPELPKNWKNPQ